MSLRSAIIARIVATPALTDLIGDRIATKEGLQGWDLPYLVLDVGPAVEEHTFGVGPNIAKARVEARFYSDGQRELDLLEEAWTAAFRGYSGISDGLKLDSWIESRQDFYGDSLESDARIGRIIDTMVAFLVGAGRIDPPPPLGGQDLIWGEMTPIQWAGPSVLDWPVI